MQIDKDLYRFKNELTPNFWFRLKFLFFGKIVVHNSIKIINRETGSVKHSLQITTK